MAWLTGPSVTWALALPTGEIPYLRGKEGPKELLGGAVKESLHVALASLPLMRQIKFP